MGPAVTAAVLAAVSVGLASHNRSEGTSRFELQEGDRVKVTVQLLSLDLPELCEVDLSMSDPERRREEERRFERCAENGLPRWLRLGTDAGSCSVMSTGVRQGEGLQVFIEGVAACPPLRGHTLTVDWGFFAGQGLDHVSTATVVIAPGVEDKTLLSRRHSRIRVKIPSRFPATLVAGVGGGVVCGVVGVLAVVGVILRRRRRRSQQAG